MDTVNYIHTGNIHQPKISTSSPLSKDHHVAEETDEIELKPTSPATVIEEGHTNFNPLLVSHINKLDHRGHENPNDIEAGHYVVPTSYLNDNFSEDDINSKPVYSDTQFDINVYQQKKTLAQGMMDLALLSANASQLRYIFEQPKESRDGFFYMSLTFIVMSLFLQVTVGIGLIWNGKYDVKNSNDCHKANHANNITVIGIFLITILNVFITAFGVPSTKSVSVPIFHQQNYKHDITEDKFLPLNDTDIT